MKKKLLILFLIFICLIIISNILGIDKKAQIKQTEVVFWTLQLGTFDTYINNVINSFEAQNPDIKINWIDVPYSEGEKRVLASLLSNSTPDLINITSDFSSILADKQALYYIEEKNMDIFAEEIKQTLTNKNGYYALPFYATSALTFYNQDLLSQANIKILPKTYNELNKISPIIKENISVYAQMPTLCENDSFIKILNKHDIDIYKNINSQNSIKLLNEYKKLYQQQYIPNETITTTHREVLEKYSAGQIVFIQAGANFLNIIKENAPDIYKKTKVSTQLHGTTPKYDFSLMNLAIPLKAKNKQAALKFALFLLNEENQLEFAKLTSILPVNKKTLENDYFNYDLNKENTLEVQTRKISAYQLKFPLMPQKIKGNKKDVTNNFNLMVQNIMLNKKNTNEAVNEFKNTLK